MFHLSCSGDGPGDGSVFPATVGWFLSSFLESIHDFSSNITLFLSYRVFLQRLLLNT